MTRCPGIPLALLHTPRSLGNMQRRHFPTPSEVGVRGKG